MPARFRSLAERNFLRRRIESGVTSMSSSGPMYSMAKSRVISFGGVRIIASSFPEERMLVSFLVLQMLTSMSLLRAFLPTTMPS